MTIHIHHNRLPQLFFSMSHQTSYAVGLFVTADMPPVTLQTIHKCTAISDQLRYHRCQHDRSCSKRKPLASFSSGCYLFTSSAVPCQAQYILKHCGLQSSNSRSNKQQSSKVSKSHVFRIFLLKYLEVNSHFCMKSRQTFQTNPLLKLPAQFCFALTIRLSGQWKMWIKTKAFNVQS